MEIVVIIITNFYYYIRSFILFYYRSVNNIIQALHLARPSQRFYGLNKLTVSRNKRIEPKKKS